jgi:hypothetical protein
MELRGQLDGEDVGRKVQKNMDKLGTVVRDAMRETAKEVADFILFRGAEDIAEAGRFGDRWQEALHADIEETQRTVRVNAYMKADEPPVTFWKVFEYGATIEAKNPSGYMWLPFSGTEGTDVWPRAYSGSLFRITSKSGLPMLLDTETKEPKYFGKESVTIPKKFHLHEIIREEAQKARATLNRILKEMRNG